MGVWFFVAGGQQDVRSLDY